MKLRAYYVFLVICAFSNVAIAQTSIVGIVTPDVIVIGADSKSTSTDAKSATLQCKIGSIKGVIWARANFATYLDKNYDANAIAREAMNREGAVSQRVAVFEHKITSRLAQVMNGLKKTQPTWFKSQVDHVIFDIVFGAFEGGRPHLFRRQFKLRDSAGGVKVELTARLDCPGDCKNGTGVAKLGHSGAVEEELKKNPYIWSLGYETAIRQLILKEVDACPKDVGLPIAIIKLDSHGPTWLSEGTCDACFKPTPIPQPAPNTNTACSD